ncbi:MarR family transcriptional regulator [Acinetobacter baumannii]
MALKQELKEQMREGLGLPQDVLYLMTEIVRYREKRLSSLLAQKGISLHEWRALRILYSFKGNVAMSELIAHSQTDRTALGRTVNQLVNRGWVKRFPAPDDKRALFLCVTEASRETFIQIWHTVADFDEELLSSLNENDQAILKRILNTMLPFRDV